ncbi:MAG: hypothetical protein A4E60_00187 [Syntrophorhabdus sp. PtaB.Bin047]|nr:MAG: hypothetical protein A4E60_00187 [Syntrophorhabdus sp. PtaB.Bin047]
MILALDCATKTGFALVKTGKIIESGTMDFSKRRGESNGAMFLRFRRWLSVTLEQIPGVKLLVYERAHHRGGAATEIGVNMAGRVQEVGAEKGIEHVPVETKTLKKWATGRGNVDKEAMIEASVKYLGRQPEDDNEADAVLLAMYAHEEYGS